MLIDVRICGNSFGSGLGAAYVLGSLAVLGTTVGGVNNVQKWEYMCIKASHSRAQDTKIGGEKASHIYQIDAIMNSLGDQGWELVGVQDPGMGSSYYGAVLFFKRPRP